MTIIDHARLPNMLAQISPNNRKFAQSFTDSGWTIGWSDIWPWLIVLMIAGAGYAWLLHYRRQNDMTEMCDDPWKLFRELSKIHGLDWPNRRLLKRLTIACGFAQPAQIFLTPQAFGGEQTPARFRDSHADELVRLRRRLF